MKTYGGSYLYHIPGDNGEPLVSLGLVVSASFYYLILLFISVLSFFYATSANAMYDFVECWIIIKIRSAVFTTTDWPGLFEPLPVPVQRVSALEAPPVRRAAVARWRAPGVRRTRTQRRRFSGETQLLIISLF